MNCLKQILEKIKVEIIRLKNEVLALFIAYQRSDVSWFAKFIAVIVVGYALSPIDLIPDFIPILGYLDDMILLPLGISFAIKLIPKDILEECREQAKTTITGIKRQNLMAAFFIVLIWILIIVWILLKYLL